MGGAGVDDAEAVVGAGEVVVHPLHRGSGGVVEVDGHHTAHGGADLVQQTAGLAEESVLGPLADLRQLDGVQRAAAAQPVQDRPDQDLKGRRGGEPGARDDVGVNAGVEAPRGEARRGDARRHAPHQGGGAAVLGLRRLQLGEGDLHGGIALGDHPNPIQAVGRGAGQHIQVHAGAEGVAVLVVGVVAAQLGAAGGAVEGGRPGVLREALRESQDNALRTPRLRASVQGVQGFFIGSAAQCG